MKEIPIKESGLSFGEYNATDLFKIEKSKIYKSIGDYICTVDFILYKPKCDILMIEAKSSSPRPDNKGDFDTFVDEIYKKFTHSIDLYFAVLIGRLNDNNKEIPDNFRNADYAAANIKLLLVINGHKKEWLPPINEALKRKLNAQIKIWRLKVITINHEIAKEYGLLC